VAPTVSAAATRSSTLAPAFLTARPRAERIALRRGLTLIGMTLVIPGSAQLAHGNERIGRIALRVWLGLVGAVVAFVVLFLLARSVAIGIYAHPFSLQVLRFATLILGAGWVFLLLNAWLIANPRSMAPKGKGITAALSLSLAIIMSFTSWTLASAFDAQSRLVSAVFGGGGSTEKMAGRYNVLLMGGDAGSDRVGLRPDTMIVASIDAETGRTVLFSLPRNMQWAPFPESSPLHKLYPNGYWCADQSCLLNAVYTLGQAHKNFYPGVKYPGAQATKEIIENVLGLTINYWAMIDLKGFQALIDAVGGIRLDVPKKVPIGGGSRPIYGWVGPGKNLKLNGFQALWFARSRALSSDYERMARQKCVLNAMVKQLSPGTVLTKFNDLAAAGEEIVATDVPTGELGTLLDLAQKGRSLPLSSVNFSPPLIRPVKPDFPLIRTVVSEKIAASEAADERAKNPTPSAEPSVEPATSAPTPSASPSPSRKAGTDDLDSVCKAS
jgi:LCP family protein required for cell wall assembly